MNISITDDIRETKQKISKTLDGIKCNYSQLLHNNMTTRQNKEIAVKQLNRYPRVIYGNNEHYAYANVFLGVRGGS